MVDDLSSGRREQVNEAAMLHVRDIAEPLLDVIAEARPEVVFHLGAQIDVRASVADPAADGRSNVLGTIRVLEAANHNDAQVVFASTGGAIYGECAGPVTEDAPRLPLSPYGTSKLTAEEYLAMWNRLYGTRHVALRLGNVYGPRQDPHGEAGVVAIFLSRIRDGQAATIYGDGRRPATTSSSATSRGRSSAPSAPRAACSTSARARRPPSSHCGRRASPRRCRGGGDPWPGTPRRAAAKLPRSPPRGDDAPLAR